MEPLSACANKITYPTKQAALNALPGAVKASSKRRRMSVYWCPFGAHYHIGHGRKRRG